jgi:hypothetical protein
VVLLILQPAFSSELQVLRQIREQEPPLDQKTMVAQLRWALEHLNSSEVDLILCFELR